MSTATFELKKIYVLSAINVNGKREYYAIDSHSGAWPYWSTHVRSGIEFDSLDKIPTIGGNMITYVTRIEVLEVTTSARVVETTELVSFAKAQAMAEIARIQADLDRKIALLAVGIHLRLPSANE
jgi:hypothetical protein